MMRNLLFTTVAAAMMSAFPAHAQTGQGAGDLTALIVEIRNLRIELVQLRMEQQASVLRELQKEAAQVRTVAESLRERERAVQAELAELDQNLGQVADPKHREQWEGAKIALLTAGPQRIAAEQTAQRQREAEMEHRLGVANQLQDSLQQALRRLQLAVPVK